jgi:hypothetical protein
MWWGLGSRWGDDRAGSANYSNNGGLWAAIWIPDGESAPGLSSEGFWPEGMLHEMSHNLGAVQSSAPHSSGYGHCWDGYDVMCYYPDGPSPRHVMTYECPTIAGVMNQGYDCGSDDYFNVAPAAGSYLATHWNVYDNVFLSGCAQIAPACGGDATTPAPALPISTAAPAVLGTAEIGSQLSLSKGTWRNEPTTYGYQWQRGGNTTWVDIPGATDSTYTVSGDDVGYRLRGLVIATNADGSTVASSGQTQMVIEAGDELPPPNATPTPTPTPTATPRPGTASPPVAAPAGAAPRVPGPSSGRVKLKVFAGKGRGKALGRVAFAIAAGRLTATTPRLRLAKGRYDVALCTTSLAGGAQRCAHRRFSAKGGHGRPPRLAIGVPAGAGARAALSVTAVGRQFGARTASRAATGLALG